jgi:hypothetical protein
MTVRFALLLAAVLTVVGMAGCATTCPQTAESQPAAQCRQLAPPPQGVVTPSGPAEGQGAGAPEARPAPAPETQPAPEAAPAPETGGGASQQAPAQ